MMMKIFIYKPNGEELATYYGHSGILLPEIKDNTISFNYEDAHYTYANAIFLIKEYKEHNEYNDLIYNEVV